MAITLLNLPAAGGVDYSSGDVDYLISSDSVRYDVTNRPTTNLAYRDTLIADKIDVDIIPTVNTLETNQSTITTDVTNIEAAVGNSGAVMTPWTGTRYYIGATSTVKTALEALDDAVNGLDYLTEVTNLQTALGTATATFIGVEGTNYVDSSDAKVAVVALDTQLGTTATQANSAAQKIDGDAGGTTVTWGGTNAYATGALNLVEGINAIDVALQVVNPTDFADVLATLNADDLANNYISTTGSARIINLTVSDALQNLDADLGSAETDIAALDAAVNDGTTGLASTYTLASQAHDLSNVLKRVVSFSPDEGAFHAIQVEVFELSGLEGGSAVDPSSRFRFSSGPGFNYWHMRPVAVPKDYGTPSVAARTYDIDVSGAIKTPLSCPEIGVSPHHMLALTWRRHKIDNNDGSGFVDPVALGAISHSRGLHGEVSDIGWTDGPWQTALLHPPYDDFATNNAAIASSTIDLDAGTLQIVFEEDYRPYYESAVANYLPLLYLSYFAVPRHDFLFFGDGTIAHGASGADAADRSLLVRSDVRGLPDRNMLSTYVPIPELSRSHWSAKFNRPLTRPGETYFTFLPKMLNDSGVIRRDIPLLVRIRAVQESALTGTCIAGPWASSVLSF